MDTSTHAEESSDAQNDTWHRPELRQVSAERTEAGIGQGPDLLLMDTSGPT